MPLAILLCLVQTADDLEKAADRLTRRAERMTGVRLANPVPVELRSRKDYETILAGEARAGGTREADSPGAVAYRLLGLLPERTDPVGTTVAMRRMQTGASYDPREKKILVLEGTPPGAALDALLFHEIVHAIQDQEHDLLALREAARTSKSHDRSLALRFLVEGEAAFWTTVYQLGALGEDFFALPKTAQRYAFSSSKSLTTKGIVSRLTQGLDESSPAFRRAAASLRSSPPILVRKHYDPYLRGMYAAYLLWEAGGRDGLRAAFRSPPACTRDMMFADRKRRPVVTVAAPALGDTLPGWKATFEDTAGALTLHALLEGDSRTADTVARAWDGDRVTVWRKEEDALLAASLVFDSKRAAAAFGRALGRLFDRAWHDGEETQGHRCAATVHRVSGPDHLLVSVRDVRVDLLRGRLPEARHDLLKLLERSP